MGLKIRIRAQWVITKFEIRKLFSSNVQFRLHVLPIRKICFRRNHSQEFISSQKKMNFDDFKSISHEINEIDVKLIIILKTIHNFTSPGHLSWYFGTRDDTAAFTSSFYNINNKKLLSSQYKFRN